MHMAMVIAAGLLLLSVFALFGRLWGQGVGDVALAVKVFVPVWAVIAVVNLWVGVARAGYTVVQELPILLVVFLVPTLVAAAMVWQLGRA